MSDATALESLVDMGFPKNRAYVDLRACVVCVTLLTT